MDVLLFVALYLFGLFLTFSIHLGFFPKKMNYPFFFLLLVGIFISIFIYRLNIKGLIFQPPTIMSILLYTLITTVVVLVCRLFKNDILTSRSKLKTSMNGVSMLTILFYLIISAPLQEFVFRSYLLLIFQHFHWNSMLFYVIFSGITFSLAHIFFKYWLISVGSLLLGMLWAAVYYYYPDLLFLSISHAVIGLLIAII